MSTTACGEHGARLLAIARGAIGGTLVPAAGHSWEEPWLRAPGASFVTLRIAQELRGCIGSVEPRRALGDDVAFNAVAAACRDPRFPPVSVRERDVLAVEVSVLSRREALAVTSESEALARLRPGVDGVYIEYEAASATFLPQVWESLPDPAEFLEHLRRKAGLPARFWHPALRVSRYTVEKYA